MAEFTLNADDRAFAQKVFDEIGEFSRDPVAGYSRQGYGPLENRVHDVLRAHGKELSLEEYTDKAGNLFLTLPGSDRSLPAVVSGSHGDTVPQGGNFDGLAGIVAALTVIRRMRLNGIVPRRDVRLIATRMEESSYFGKAYVGTLSMTGQLKEADLALKHRTEDQTLAEAIRAAGFSPEDCASGKPLDDLSKIAAFLELHIEQGPTLDANTEKRVGVVTGIRGNLRHKKVRCIGETAHSGAVNREFRHDAVLATADLLMRMEKHWVHRLDRGEDLVFTAGVVKTSDSAAIAKVPGEVTFCVDMRSLSMGTLEQFHELLLRDAEKVGKERGVKFEFDAMLRTESAKLSAGLVAKVANTASACGIPYIAMPSGAGHDAAVIANAGVPAAMIFVANQHGSHNPHEAMQMDDFMKGAELLYHVVTRFDA